MIFTLRGLGVRLAAVMGLMILHYFDINFTGSK